MATPSRNEIFVGISFVFVGLAFALCDRWQREQTLQGVITRKPHKFDHLFMMWMLMQFCQLGLLFVWAAIEYNWLCCGRFRHWGQNDRGHVIARAQSLTQLAADDGEDDAVDGNGHEHHIAGFDDGENEDQAENHLVEHQQEPDGQIKRKIKKPSKLIYFPPAFFALAHILLLYFGMKLTYSSSFIMLKGTVAFFTALLSLAFLAHQLTCYVWFGVIVTTLGFVVSGISDYIKVPYGGFEKYGIAAGDLLILMSQIMFATKIVYEEKFIRKHSIHPMLFLGCEGIYGSFFAIIFLLVFNFVDAVQYSNLPNGHLEDVHDFALQFLSSWRIILAVLGAVVLYIVYTCLGMVLIRDHGALPRIMIEALVWCFYWAVCLLLHWEHFFIAQVPGLCFIVIGTLIYSHIVVLPFASRFEKTDINVDQDYFNTPLEDQNDFGNQPNDNRDQPNERNENVIQDDDDSLLHDEAPFVGHVGPLVGLHDDPLIDADDNVQLIADVHENDAETLRRRGGENI